MPNEQMSTLTAGGVTYEIVDKEARRRLSSSESDRYRAWGQNVIFTALRADDFNGYRLNCATYADGYYYLMGGKATPNGTSQILKTTSLTDPIGNGTFTTLNLGHCNDCTYDPVNDKIIVACGGGSVTAELEYTNKIAIVDPSDFSVEYKVFDEGMQTYGIEYYKNGFILLYQKSDNGTLYQYMDQYDLSFNYVRSLASYTKDDLAEFASMDQAYVYRQSMASIDDKVYVVGSLLKNDDGTNIWYAGYMFEIDFKTNKFVSALTVRSDESQEVESVLIKDGKIYWIMDGDLWVSIGETNPRIVEEPYMRNITANSDLDTYLIPGTYSSISKANTGTLLHKPSDLTKAFRMDVIKITVHNRKQIIYESEVTNRIFYRYIHSSPKIISDWYVITPTVAN